MGLCSQLDLDFAVQKAARKAGRVSGDVAAPRTLIPASEVEGTAAYAAAEAEREASPAPERESEKEYDADSVFAKLKNLKREDDE